MTDPESDFIPPTAPELDLDIGDAIHIKGAATCA